MTVRRKKMTIQFEDKEQHQAFLNWAQSGDLEPSKKDKARRAMEVARKTTKRS